ncbi:MAG: NUDIX hydrolase [Kiloniellales bacterium]|nr:NUDIX hydrolase [Kiloniellales bacterium]
MNEPQWLKWAKELQAIAQIGLTFAENGYDLERYRQVRAVAAQIMAAGAVADIGKIQTLFDGETGYATPKVDVRGAAFRDGRVLMVRETSDGRWTLPGGWADVNESPRAAIAKEMREESGFEVEIVKLAAVYDRSLHAHEPPMPFHMYKLFFLCEITGGAPATSLETSGVDFFAPDALPELSVGRVLPFQIARMFAHRAEPELPTEFD